MTMSLLSTPTSYQALPQAPTTVEELESVEEDDEQVGVQQDVSLDSRVRWIHFVFGCAVLLPWNGASQACCDKRYALIMRMQH